MRDSEENTTRQYGFFGRGDIFWAGLVFFASYFFYLISLFPTVTSEDSGELTAAAHTLGVAHPPGYPLFVILAKLFTIIVPFGNIGWRVNAFSAFFGAAAVAMLFLLVRLLSSDTAIGVITSLLFAGGEIFWSQAIRAEVYTLNAFFLLLVIFLAVMWYFAELSDFQTTREGTPPPSSKLFYALAFIYGLSLTNHPLMLLAGPPLLIFIFIAKPKILLDYKAVLYFFIGLSLYLCLPIFASYQPAVNWGNPVNWENFWTHVTRQIYSADSISAAGHLIYGTSAQAGHDTTTAASAISEFLRQNVWSFFGRFFVILDSNYTWIAGLLAILGFIALWIRTKAVFWLFVLLIIFNSVVMASVTGVGITDKLPSLYFTDRPFFIPLLLLTSVMAGLGIRYIASILYESGKRTVRASKRNPAIFFVALLLIGILALKFPSQDQHGNFIAKDIAKTVLDLLPPNAVLHSSNGDNTAFPILYLQAVEGYRTDITVYIDMPFSVFKFFRSFEDFANENKGRRIFTDFPFSYYPNKDFIFLGPIAEIVPSGTLGQKKSAETEPSSAPSNKPFLLDPNAIRGFNWPNLDFFHLYLKARFYLDLGLALQNDSAAQRANFEKAFAIAPLSRNITGQLIGNYYVRKGNFKEAIPYLRAAREYMPDEYPINFQLALALIIDGNKLEAEKLISSLSRDQQKLLLKEMAIFASMHGADYPSLRAFEQNIQYN
jgi:hypothetical protein